MKPASPEASKSPRKYLTARRLVYFALGLGVLFLLLRQIDLRALSRQVLTVQPLFLLLGGLFYLGKAAVRAWRLARLNARSSPGYLQMLRLTLASNLVVQIVPLKLGELSYVYLLKKEQRASVSQGLSSLVILRIFDMLAVALLFLLISLALRLPPNLSVYFFSVLGLVGALLALVIAILAAAHHPGVVLPLAFRFLPREGAIFQKARGALESILSELRQYPAREYAGWAALAALEWFINYGSFQALLVGIGMRPSFYDTVVSVTFAALAAALPVNSFGSFGTQEVGWAAGLVLLGYGREAAITSGFATHILTVGYVLLFGGIAWLTYLARGSAPRVRANVVED